MGSTDDASLSPVVGAYLRRFLRDSFPALGDVRIEAEWTGARAACASHYVLHYVMHYVLHYVMHYGKHCVMHCVMHYAMHYAMHHGCTMECTGGRGRAPPAHRTMCCTT